MFTLRYPVRLAPGRTVKTGSGVEIMLAGYTATLEQRGRYLVFKVRGFSDESDASDFIPTLRAGMSWAALNLGLVHEKPEQLRAVTYAPDPKKAGNHIFGGDKELDGLIDAGFPSVYPSEKRIAALTAGDVSVGLATDTAPLADALATGIAVVSPSSLTDEAILTALDLYCAAHTEVSQRARLLTHVIGLESLASPPEKHPVALNLLEQWTRQIRGLSARYQHDSPERTSLEALEREMLHRKQLSLRQSVRLLVYSCLALDDEEEATLAAKEAVQVYDMRSLLAHTGSLPKKDLDQAASRAERILRRVLEQVLRHGRPASMMYPPARRRSLASRVLEWIRGMFRTGAGPSSGER